jgi:bifunctional non-homologous end joining protein LigD
MTASIPEWLEPMAATLTQERFTGPEWIFERKYDGIRALAFKQGNDVRLLSRNRLPQHNPPVCAAISRLDVENAILDGELAWRGDSNVSYHVFDLLWFDSQDLTRLSLDERKAILATLRLEPPMERVVPLDDAAPWERACAEGWEGVIAKRRDAVYEHRRSPLWLKMKCEATQELVVGGFTDPQGKRTGLGALLVGYYEPDDHFVYAGKVGTGFDVRLLRELRERLDRLEIAASPFTKAKGLPRVRAHWVRPEIVVQVSFIEWTAHGKLRHSRLIGLRPDKPARDVVRETT